MTKLRDNPALRRLLYCFAGLVLGVIAALIMTSLVMFLFSLIPGSGENELTRGIMGTLLMVFSAPIFGLIGVGIAYSKSIRKEQKNQ